MNTGAEPRRWGNVNPMLVPLQSFETANGDLIVAVANDEQWQRFCAAAELSELAEDSRFATNTERVKHRDDLVPRIAEVIRQRDTQYWLARLQKHGVPAGPVRTASEALVDPLVEERKLVWKGVGEDEQELLMLANPLAHLSRTPARLYGSPPTPGEDTAQVLGDFLGYSERKVKELRETRAV